MSDTADTTFWPVWSKQLIRILGSRWLAVIYGHKYFFQHTNVGAFSGFVQSTVRICPISKHRFQSQVDHRVFP
jgi:hypothetical protein